ncbi:hypothetical protein [Flavihumibacter solisilvae]|uniref:TonB C-terminal domain-containing protein n=1 Tax=Flavihumibacter solisilvae TaxID=1349421 RepID=A0A0C1L4S0_9BACT|nr:hypothetical protein [Flavihumibacter solisilvae]KIC94531.1 hypothetical protein OI18_10435 [Flavihumibacter solisilvae]
MLRALLFILLAIPALVNAQRTITWNGMQVNALDKHGRKQGEWLFFDKQGNVQMQCRFQADKVEGPRVFYNGGDTVLVRFQPVDSLEHFIYYYKNQPVNGVFVQQGDNFRIEVDHIPAGFTDEDLRELKNWYAVKIDPVYMFATQPLIEYFSAAYYKSSTIPNMNHNFVITINASGKVTNVEWGEKDELWTANMERELFGMIYSMGRWQPFFDTWQTKEIKLTMSLGADLSSITAR